MICYAVVDTNILVSALLSKNESAATVQVMVQLLSGRITPVYSNEIIAEYREVLSRKKFQFPTEQIGYFLRAIEKFGILVDPTPTGMILPDMKDLPFFEVVMEKRSDNAYLVTGNQKHFPKEPFIVTAREMINILDQMPLTNGLTSVLKDDHDEKNSKAEAKNVLPHGDDENAAMENFYP